MLSAARLYASSGTEGAAFLDIPVGAGPAAMGSAYTALATNVYAPVYNPAGLGFLNGTQISGQHLSYLESIHYEHVGAVHPLAPTASGQKRGIGFSAQYLGSGDMAGTNENGDSTGNFSSHYAAYNVAYGQTLAENVSIGLTGKWINAKIDDVSANAFAADLGVLYRPNDKLSLGSSIVNLGSKLKFLSEGDSLPLAFHAAAAYKITRQWMTTVEGIYRKNGLGSAHVGTEWRPLEALALRVGYKTDTLDGLSALAGLTTGIGIYVYGQELAYAFSPYSDLGNAQYFSLIVRFGEDLEARRNLIQYQYIRKHQTVKVNKGSTSGSSAFEKSNAQNTDSDADAPEYQELMQLLSHEDTHVAQTADDKELTPRE